MQGGADPPLSFIDVGGAQAELGRENAVSKLELGNERKDGGRCPPDIDFAENRKPALICLIDSPTS